MTDCIRRNLPKKNNVMNMKSTRYILPAIAALAMLSACGLFKKYSSDVQAPENLFGTSEAVSLADDGKCIADLSYRDFFTDPLLRSLIDTALVRNVDVAAARGMVAQADAYLKSAKLGYLPSLSFNPLFNITPGMSYAVPVQADWGVQGFGSITNRLRETKALVLQSDDNLKNVQSLLVSKIALAYTNLQFLDRELEIMKQTESVWTDMVSTQKALMENGKAYSTAVDQLEASLLGVVVRKMDIEEEIADTEGAICMLLGKTPQHIRRSVWTDFRMPESISAGIPAALLERRADVRAAGRAVEAAYYVTNQARSAMFPSLNLSGLVGWTSQGGAISDPGRLLYNAVLSLAQPIFAQGRLRASLKVARLRQETAADEYVQTILEAGNQVNKALRECSAARQKDEIYRKQVETLTRAYDGTSELMRSGKAMYLEVLNAQNTLLDAQIGQAANIYCGMAGLINAYIALGGGTE